MAAFDRAIKTAEKLIAKYGQEVIWRIVKDAVAPDPLKPWKPGEMPDENKTVTVCFIPMDRESKQLFAYLRGTSDVPTGHTLGLMKGNVDFDPALQDIIVRDGSILRIKSIDLLSPNGQKVLYTMEFEG